MVIFVALGLMVLIALFGYALIVGPAFVD